LFLPLNTDLDTLFKSYPAKIGRLARELTALVLEIRPDFVAKVSFGWQTVNFRHPKAGFVNAVYVRPDRVLLVFQDGRLLDHPLLVDDGKVKRVRWIAFAPGDDFPVDEIAILIAEAIALRS
jgi:hypothetical protein